MKIVEKDQSVEYIQPNKQGAFQSAAISSNESSEKTGFYGAQQSLEDIQGSTIEKLMNKEQYVKCVEYIQFSAFNPVPASRKLAGDLFYLTVKTADSGERGITCCVNGFYVNDSVEKGVFSPGPSQRKTQAGKPTASYSYTLIGCLNQISVSFGKNMQKYINQILNTEQYFLTKPNLPVYEWA